MTTNNTLIFSTPAEVAVKLGWSERRVRDVARRAGACRILGRVMVFTEGDVSVMEGIADGELSKPPEKEKIKYGSAHVYFFLQGEFVKIGWSNKWRKRLMTLQSATPFPITPIAVFRGTPTMERRLHEQFAEHRARLEWFHYCSEIKDYIEANKSKCVKDAKNSLVRSGGPE